MENAQGPLRNYVSRFAGDFSWHRGELVELFWLLRIANLSITPPPSLVTIKIRIQTRSKPEYQIYSSSMSTSKIAPQQYKQPSRKGKKAWRKNVDITEVQRGLELLREELIQGCVFNDLVYKGNARLIRAVAPSQKRHQMNYSHLTLPVQTPSRKPTPSPTSP